MKKKILSVLLAFALLIILPACGGPADEPPTTESASIPDLSAQTDKTMGRFHTDAILDETVLTDEGGVKITATGLTYTAYSADLNLRFLYKGIIIKHNKTEPTYTKTSLFLCEKRRFFMARTEKGGKVF